jgi:uncharacterized protein YyaL (SSP411 family)
MKGMYLLIFVFSCRNPMPETANHLIHESSLYLQQHAHNPVDWYPWTDEAWEKARKENKLVLVSIGYSSCHWCHVMEHESFMDTGVARIMNEHFICIKVDREERPDIDQVYMTAVQLMTGSGGWPLNCFVLPDGRPVYGGTYFPRENWKQVLIQLDSFYRSDPQKCMQYAEELTSGIQQGELIRSDSSGKHSGETLLQNAVKSWKNNMDFSEGGPNYTPKFPLPVNFNFLLRYAVANNDRELLDYVQLTLNKMAFGGIYDQVGGGFSRYSTDKIWKAPHFEKMLYDNAQLVGLYANAYKVFRNPLYREIAENTISFLEKEMSDGHNGYFSAIDADSEGEEGKFYVWSRAELDSVSLPELSDRNSHSILYEYFNVNDSGYWEKGNYILLRKKSDAEIASRFNLSTDELSLFISKAKKILLEIRNKRPRPGLDKKIITSWNALHISALCNAFEAFGNDSYRQMAVECANGILHKAVKEGKLLHVRDQKHVQQGYLEDYAFTITAFADLYQVTADESWLLNAKSFADEAIMHFRDGNDGMFYFTPSSGTQLIARRKEISDNVIASSNSQMAVALFLLGEYFPDADYTRMAKEMTGGVEENIIRYPSSHANWMNVKMNFIAPSTEIVITGPKALDYLPVFQKYYLPDVLYAASTGPTSSLPLLQQRTVSGRTLVYVCRNRTCYLPVENPDDALNQLSRESAYLKHNVEYSE